MEGAQVGEGGRAHGDLVEQVRVGGIGPPAHERDLVVHGVGVRAQEDDTGAPVLLGHAHAEEVAVEGDHPLEVRDVDADVPETRTRAMDLLRGGDRDSGAPRRRRLGAHDNRRPHRTPRPRRGAQSATDRSSQTPARRAADRRRPGQSRTTTARSTGTRSCASIRPPRTTPRPCSSTTGARSGRGRIGVCSRSSTGRGKTGSTGRSTTRTASAARTSARWTTSRGCPWSPSRTSRTASRPIRRSASTPGLTRADGARTPIKLQSSGSTTGMPRPTLFTPWEWEVQGIQGSRALWLQGARPGDVMQIPSTLSTANLGWFYYLSCLHCVGRGAHHDGERQRHAEPAAARGRLRLGREPVGGVPRVPDAPGVGGTAGGPRPATAPDALHRLVPRARSRWQPAQDAGRGLALSRLRQLRHPRGGVAGLRVRGTRGPPHDGGHVHRRGRRRRHGPDRPRRRAGQPGHDEPVPEAPAADPLQPPRLRPHRRRRGHRVPLRELHASHGPLPGPERRHGEAPRDERVPDGVRPRGDLRRADDRRVALRRRAGGKTGSRSATR